MFASKNMHWQDTERKATIPMRTVGPVKIISHEVDEEVPIPLATLESPLWPSTHRAARLINKSGGIHAAILEDKMTRSILVEADRVAYLQKVYADLAQRQTEIAAIVAGTSHYAQFVRMHPQIIGSLLYIRLELTTGDAAGHNMVTLAADKILKWLLKQYKSLRHVSVSGNFCTDKKVSAVNGILGRGKNVVAEAIIPHRLCTRYLHATPAEIINLHIKKNLLGSIVAGGLRTANAHFANMLLAFYLATGQDAANIVEGSQGIVHTELRNEDLYFSVTLPNLIVGTVGNGKDLPYVQENLNMLGCLTKARGHGYNARRLAIIASAVVLCGELSLLAAQTNIGELMKSHIQLERKKIKADA